MPLISSAEAVTSQVNLLRFARGTDPYRSKIWSASISVQLLTFDLSEAGVGWSHRGWADITIRLISRVKAKIPVYILII